MNREIKFRFWGKALKPPHFIDLSNWRIYTNTGEEVLNGSFGLFNNPLIIPQQYTGLKDKNGREIYEGDVVNLKGNVGTVIFKNGCFSIKGCFVSAYNKPVFYLLINCLESEYYEIEILGNIFENPKLFFV